VFRGEAVLVTVDVYPQREGKIVEGLKAEDFQVLEDGKPQVVENVEFVRVEPSLSESERRDPGSMSEMLRQASDPHNRVFVVFLDQMHVTIEGSHATRRPMVDTLNRIIGETDMFGVMTQNTDPRALTFGRRLLTVEEQLSKYWNWGERHRITPDPLDPMEDMLQSWFTCKPPKGLDPCPLWWFFDNGQRRYLFEHLIERRREDRTLTALENLVDRLAGMREARTVVLVVTEGWRLFRASTALANEAGVYGPQLPPIRSSGGTLTVGDKSKTPNASAGYLYDAQNELVRLATLENDRRFRDLLTSANRANVSFYPINPSGLPTVDTPISEDRPPSLGGRR
jgi:VWFA-related protein